MISKEFKKHIDLYLSDIASRFHISLDRCVESKLEDNLFIIEVYGWIRLDFVFFEIEVYTDEGGFQLTHFITSSAKISKNLAHYLKLDSHNDCIRYDDYFRNDALNTEEDNIERS